MKKGGIITPLKLKRGRLKAGEFYIKLNLLFLLLVAVFFKQIVWLGLVPLWHFPDEQAHFAQVQNYVEVGLEHIGTSSDEIAHSEQLLGVWRNEMGRNDFTMNPTHNLEYSDSIDGLVEQKIIDFPREYSTDLELREATSYPFLYYWASGLLYRVQYWQSFIDRVFVTRFFNVVIFVGIVWLTVLIGRVVFGQVLVASSKKQVVSSVKHNTEDRIQKKIQNTSSWTDAEQSISGSRWIFRKGLRSSVSARFTADSRMTLLDMLALTLGLLVGFHPMFSFVGAGVTSDVLFVWWFTLLIYGCLLVLKNGKNEDVGKIKGSLFHGSIVSWLYLWRGWLWIVVALVGGFLTKQQMAIGVVIVGGVVLYILLIWLSMSRKKSVPSFKFQVPSRKSCVYWFLIGIGVFALLGLAIKYGEIGRISGFIKAGQGDVEIGLLEHIRWTLLHTYREVLPWYWGVYKWLGVTLPRWVNRVQMGILLFSGIGLGVYIITQLRIANDELKKQEARSKKQVQNLLLTTYYLLLRFVQKERKVLFLLFASITYFLAVTLWDWQFRQSYGFSFGVQGRYFFPTIVCHMSLIIIGLLSATNLIVKISNCKFLIPKKIPNSQFSTLIACYSGKQVPYSNLLLTACYLLLALALWWIILHFIALWTVAQSYYDVSSWNSFLIQASQYKPWLFKGDWWGVWIGLMVVTILWFLFIFVKTVFTKYRLSWSNFPDNSQENYDRIPS